MDPRTRVLTVDFSLAVGLVLILGWAAVASPAATLLVGMGVGLALYRVRYGVLGPIPAQRKEQAQGTGTSELDPPTGQS